MFQKLEILIDSLDIDAISDDRRSILQPFREFLKTKLATQQRLNLNFICTHNSRRSRFGQIWAQTIAAFYHYDQVHCYSGGTEATGLFPQVIETLSFQGFQIMKLSEGKNAINAIKYADNALSIIGFSKEYDHLFNPKSEFSAIMTCSQADAGCPFIAGAEARFALNYEDPKAFDGTSRQTEKYLERSIQIATEMKFIFSNV